MDTYKLLEKSSKILFNKSYIALSDDEEQLYNKIIENVFKKYKNKKVSENEFYALLINEYINILKGW